MVKMSLDVYLMGGTSGETVLFEANITHNLSKMAQAAGLYEYLWRPEEVGIEKAADLIDVLSRGYMRMWQKREQLEEHSPENGWGSFEGLVRFVGKYRDACIEFPDAKVEVWR